MMHLITTKHVAFGAVVTTPLWVGILGDLLAMGVSAVMLLVAVVTLLNKLEERRQRRSGDK